MDELRKKKADKDQVQVEVDEVKHYVVFVCALN